jgi:MFS family permease
MKSSTFTPWLILAMASAGWVFDVYEGQLFTIFKTPALADVLGVTEAELSDSSVQACIDRQANVGLALFLVGGAAGGLGFAMLGDRMGRVRVMALTILTYSVFSALTAFARTAWQVNLLRFFVALGTGGEWAVAAALVAETFPSRLRAFASGTFHASSVLGAGLASLTGWLLAQPGGWRTGFLLGLAPALLVLVVRLALREPESWRPGQAGDGAGRGGLGELLGPGPWRSRAWIGLGLAAVGLGTYWGIFAWGPELVYEVLGPGVPAAERQAKSSLAYLIMNFTGGLAGLLMFAPVASAWGRRAAFAVYHLGALVLVPVTFLGTRTYDEALVLLPLLAFFVVGLHAGYAIYFPELFPTRLRATGAGFCFNVGRLLGGAVLLVRGTLRTWLDLRHAVVAMASLFVVGLVLLAFAPETHDRPLPE